MKLIGFLSGYNLPELGNEMRLVLDFNVLAGIYLQNITMWDDQRIKDINAPVVASFLPSQKIRVIVEDQDQQGFQKILSAALRASVPEFAAVVPTFHSVEAPLKRKNNPNGTTAQQLFLWDRKFIHSSLFWRRTQSTKLFPVHAHVGHPL